MRRKCSSEMNEKLPCGAMILTLRPTPVSMGFSSAHQMFAGLKLGTRAAINSRNWNRLLGSAALNRALGCSLAVSFTRSCEVICVVVNDRHGPIQKAVCWQHTCSFKNLFTQVSDTFSFLRLFILMPSPLRKS